MAKEKKKPNILIVALAYFHRYGWIVLMLLLMCIIRKMCVLGIGCVAFSVWTFFGYILRWKHIYCSYQNAYHMPMTPDNINWDTVKKTDAYGIPAILMILGVALLLV